MKRCPIFLLPFLAVLLMPGCSAPESDELARCRQMLISATRENEELKSQNDTLAQSLRDLIKTTNETSADLEQNKKQQPKKTP